MASSVATDFFNRVDSLVTRVQYLQEKILKKKLQQHEPTKKRHRQGHTEYDYRGMKVTELKTLLRDRGLPVSGTKAKLLSRLESSSCVTFDVAKNSGVPLPANQYAKIRVIEDNGVVHINLEPIQNLPFVISAKRYDQLRGIADNYLSISPNSGVDPEELVYCMLTRYESLEGKVVRSFKSNNCVKYQL